MILPEENVSLSLHTTMRTGGNARYFFSVKTELELISALIYAQKIDLPVVVLGEGSNVLVRDENLNFVVIRMCIPGILFESGFSGSIRVIAGAGESWDHFVSETVARGLHGLENLSGIPGTVGAAPIQNIGAYGTEVKNVIECVETIHKKTLKKKRFTNRDCQFSYRNSFFKSLAGGDFIVTQVSFMLSNFGKTKIEYNDLVEYFKKNSKTIPTISDVRDVVKFIRSKKFPNLSTTGTAGSFFKNPEITQSELLVQIEKMPSIRYFPSVNGKVKVSASWLLDNIGGWKGFRDGDAGVHDAHALVLVNHNHARASEILALSEKIAKDVYIKTGIILEREVVII